MMMRVMMMSWDMIIMHLMSRSLIREIIIIMIMIMRLTRKDFMMELMTILYVNEFVVKSTNSFKQNRPLF